MRCSNIRWRTSVQHVHADAATNQQQKKCCPRRRDVRHHGDEVCLHTTYKVWMHGVVYTECRGGCVECGTAFMWTASGP